MRCIDESVRGSVRVVGQALLSLGHRYASESEARLFNELGPTRCKVVSTLTLAGIAALRLRLVQLLRYHDVQMAVFRCPGMQIDAEFRQVLDLFNPPI